jgi:hypothetical protein
LLRRASRIRWVVSRWLGLLVLTGAVGACGRAAEAPPLAAVRLSILAVGDTGWRNGLPGPLDPQMRVAKALRSEDRVRPSDALVLLGDNFYPEGLRAPELAPRIRENLIEPYCAFLDLSGPQAAEVAGACGVPEEARRGIPLYAILGDHDYESADGPELEKQAIPRFIANWRMPDRAAQAVELGEGVSLVLVDGPALIESDDGSALREALQRAAGPWRILAIHRPLGTRKIELDELDPAHTRYARLVRDALVKSGVDLHLVISGDEHSLQILEMPKPFPPLHVVAGGGCCPREIDSASPYRRFGVGELGFLRIDLVGGEDGRLVASLFALPSQPLRILEGARLVARWSVDRALRVRDDLTSQGPAGA